MCRALGSYRISSLTSNMFTPLSKLVSLDLNNNTLTSLPQDIFFYTSELRYL